MWDGVSAVQFIPHLSVLDNLTLAPRRVLGKSKQESEKQARFYLDKVGLAEKGLIQTNFWWTKATVAIA